MNLEQKRYYKIARSVWTENDPFILKYDGNNIIKKIYKQFVKCIKDIKTKKNEKMLYISYLAVVCSFECNLNCIGCGQHTPYIKKLDEKERNIDFNKVLRDLERVYSIVDGIGGLALANGEGFLNPNLEGIIDYYSSKPNILSINIPTNGSIVPDDAILEKMVKNNVTATITKYDCIPEEKRRDLMSEFKRRGIKYTYYDNREWYDHEYIEDIICDEKEAIKKYKHCERYFMLMQGKLWKCEVQATGVYAGKRPLFEDDYIEIDSSTDEEIRDFISRKCEARCIESCRHCRGGCGSMVKVIPAGEQPV